VASNTDFGRLAKTFSVPWTWGPRSNPDRAETKGSAHSLSSTKALCLDVRYPPDAGHAVAWAPADNRATQREFVRLGDVRARRDLRRASLPISAPIGWLAWPSISWLKLAGTDVQRWKKAYPTVLQVRRAAQLIACGALVDVRVVEVVAFISGTMAGQRI
jgi:hypothetical protein